MADRLATAVDLALFELNADLLSGVRDRLRNTKQINSVHATILVGRWVGRVVAIVSPKEIQDWEDFIESIQLTHKPKMMLGIKVTSTPSKDSSETETRPGKLYSMCDPKDFSDLPINDVLNYFPPHGDKQANLLFPVLGSMIPEAGLFKQRTIARSMGGLAGKLLKQPKELLKVPHSISTRLTVQVEIADQLERVFKQTTMD